jgi:hypothetical protein
MNPAIPLHRKDRSAGFALLITLTLLAFLILLLVSLSALTRVETQVADNTQKLSSARQNALLALNLAMGALQRAAGPDQRATAPAAILDSSPATNVPDGLSSPQWTGVWGRTGTAADFVNPASPSQPVLLSWLVSGNEAVAFTPSTAANDFGRISTSTSTAAIPFRPEQAVAGLATSSTALSTDLTINGEDAVLLVGPNTVDFTTLASAQANAVIAPLKDLDAQNVPGLPGTQTIGRYAWWVGDEGVKARVNLVDPYVVPSPAMTTAGLPAAPESKARLRVAQRMGIERIPDITTYPANHTDSRKVLGMEQLSLVDTGITSAESRTRFHDLTATSRTVLTDQLNGGLKRDLTYAFAQSLPNFRAALGLTAGGPNPLIPTTLMPASERGPTWEQIWSLGNITGAPSDPVTPRPQDDSTHGINPIIAQFRLYLGGTVVDHPTDPSLRVFVLHIYPCVVIANPYTVPLAAATYRFRLDASASQAFRAVIKPAPTPGPGSPPHQWAAPGGLRALFEGQVFSLNSTSTLAPGASQTFTLGSNEDWAVTKTYTLQPGCDWTSNGVGMSRIVLNTGWPVRASSLVGPPSANGNGIWLFVGDGTIDISGTPTIVNGSAGNWRFSLLNTAGTRAYDRMDFIVMWSTVFDAPITSQDATPANVAPDNILSGLIIKRFDSASMDASRTSVPVGSSSITGALRAPVFAFASQFNWRTPVTGLFPYFNATGTYLSQNGVIGGALFSKTNLIVPGSNAVGRFLHFEADDPDQHHPQWAGGVGAVAPVAQGRDEWQAFDVPRKDEWVSIGQLQHFNVSGSFDDVPLPPPATWTAATIPAAMPKLAQDRAGRSAAPAYAIGNSRAHFMVPRHQIKNVLDRSSQGDTPFYDFSYLLNRQLFDSYYFSTYPQTGTVDLNSARLANPRLRSFRDDVSLTDPGAFRGVSLPARNLLLEGGFNVNSTSVEAWVALLSAFKGTEFNAETNLEGAFLRSTLQTGGSTANTNVNQANAWNGFRNLTAVQVRALAEKIVEQIKLRGPAVSLADFVNRRLIEANAATANQGLSGPLQSALDATAINAGFPTTLPDAGNPVVNQTTATAALSGYVDVAHRPAHVLDGIAGWLTQADLLQPLAPVLAARSDTFRIRTYGETRNPVTEAVEGRAWCEAIVQRLPDYLNASADDATRPPAALSDPTNINQTLGRRFHIVSFRWLNPEEI